ncbi:cytochrome P450 3A29-like isoform X5 [Pomacea canaliculata]|uniref:cytochrome P450 3A29-like isoform X4 n=1 Tax=Pomacea canaliculata TaxID=400727 RepID=UPI000D72A373|nr:cytochrome P450 3A29-like isoform X4 [Pomacea canaliculata]XP_025103421.1 cytochrome P450 3A29-like isoform X5 [Pomacea canaliculata]
MDVLGLVDVPVWLMLLIILVLTLYVYGTWNHGFFTSLGIPGPKPLPFLGNARAIEKKGFLHALPEWRKQFGHVYGFFFALKPMLVVSDLDILKEILVKDFNNFADRFFIAKLRPPIADKGLFFTGGSTWKRLRRLMTPTFTSGKLKNMSHLIDRCANILKDNIQELTRRQEVIDIKDVFGAFTMDVVAGTAFGLETNSQTQPAEPFVQSCQYMFRKMTGNSGRLLTIVAMFPFLTPLIRTLGKGISTGEEADFLVHSVYRMVDERRQVIGDEKRTDLLQLLVNAEDTGLEVGQKRMTREEVAAQGVIILIAGYETTATTLQYLTYNLAKNQDVQQRVYEEMRDELGDEDPTYDNVGRLKYLDNVIHETLRLFPPVALIHRQALHSRTIKGVTIPAGVGVYIPIYSIMHDPDYFDDPEKFWPERFSEAESSKLPSILSELAFGYGPRQCIGMRLALLEIKFAAVRILRHFRFLPCEEDTPDKIEFVTAGLTSPKKPIKLRTELRV